ncbi:SDR family NAD(P)-dependent oxidoreductase [Congregibacter sp.]|uniref:SDR family NAD(P)-dependent oxidoreductase n=1 Tax=Congregibacter sp. TaxID=2744308 RepID=UPI00385FC930
MGVENLRIVITGAAVGIGAGTAKLAAQRGASVVLSDLNSKDGEALAAEIVSDGGRAIFVPCDVTNEDDVQALMAAASDAFGGIDVLHNNAGIHESLISSDLTLETMTRETFERVISVNLTGAWLCAKYALPYLRKSDSPSIINAGSTSSITGYPQCQAYGASKGGIMQLTKMLAVDLAADGIRVNCYCPGAIHTQIVDNFLAAAPDPAAMLSTMTNTHLIPRMGQPVDVAELVCFLASPESEFVNGVVWNLDGGSLAWRGTIDILGMEAKS